MDGLRRGIPLWLIEDQLDWQENQDPRRAEDNLREQREPVVQHSVHGFVSSRKSVVHPGDQGTEAIGRLPRRSVFVWFGWFFNQVMGMMRFLFCHKHRR